MASTTWTWDQFSQSYPRETWESFLDWHMSAALMIGSLYVTMSYPIHHQLLTHFVESYRKLPDHQQVVVIQHSIEAFTLSILFVPLSYLIFSLNFEKQSSLETAAKKVQALGSLMFILAIMYLVELATRYKHSRPVVIAHHLITTANTLFSALFLTTANIRAASILVYFITYETIIFIGLLMYRLHGKSKWTPRIMLVGMLVMGFSRPIQVVWIIGSLVATWDDLVIWHAVVQIVLSITFTSLQLYSLTIHYGIYQKSVKMQKKIRGKNASQDGTGTNEEADKRVDHFADVEEDYAC